MPVLATEFNPYMLISIVAAIAALAVVSLTVCFLQTKKLKVKTVRAGEGELCRIGVISDLHFPMVNVDLDCVIDTLCKNDCDAVVIAGDLCQNKKGEEKMLRFVEKLAGALESVPLVIVAGNHDAVRVCGRDPLKIDEYVKKVEGCGANVKFLRDEIYVIRMKGTERSIVTAGFDEYCLQNEAGSRDLYGRALAAAGENEKLLLLMHNPDTILRIEDAVKQSGRSSVTVAGHTHGGQFYLPFNLEFALLRDDILPKKGYVYGLYDYCGRNKMYITCGLGQSFVPLRLGTTPEIAFVEF